MCKSKKRRLVPQKFYHKLIISFGMVSFLIVLLISTVSHTLYSRRFTREIAAGHRQAMAYNSQILYTELFQETSRIFINMLMDKRYAQIRSFSLDTEASPRSHVMLLNAYELLKSVKSLSTGMLSDAVIYFPQQNMLVSATAGYKSLTDKRNDRYRERVSEIPVSKSEGLMAWYCHEGPEGNELVLVGAPRWDKAGPQAVLVYLYINRAYPSGLLGRAAVGNTAFLVNGSGQIAAASANAPQSASIPEHVWAKRLDAYDGFASIVDERSASREMYSFIPIPTTQWQLAVSQPLGDYMRSVRAITAYTLSIMAICLLIFFPLTLVISRRLYSPLQQLDMLVRQLPDPPRDGLSRNEHDAISATINMLVSRLGEAQRVLYDQKPLIRHMQLRQLLEGHGYHEDIHAADNLAIADIALPGPYFMVVLCEWSLSDELRLAADLWHTLRFTLSSHVERVCGRGHVHVYGYVADKGRVAWIVNAQSADEGLGMQIAQAANAYLAKSMVRSLCSLGGWHESIMDIHLSGLEAEDLMRGRFFVAADAACITAKASGDTNTALTEVKYAQALEAMNLHEARACLRRLVDAWRMLEPSLALASLQRIGNTTTLAYMERTKGTQASDIRLLAHPIQTLWQAEEYPEAIFDLLRKTFAQDNDAGDLLERTDRFILENLSADLGLDAIASAMHFSPKYFSRLYYKLSGVKLNEQINTLRLEHAARLLSETSLSIEEIARRTGYSSTQYFIRKFKERYQVTPRRYKSPDR